MNAYTGRKLNQIFFFICQIKIRIIYKIKSNHLFHITSKRRVCTKQKNKGKKNLESINTPSNLSWRLQQQDE